MPVQDWARREARPVLHRKRPLSPGNDDESGRSVILPKPVRQLFAGSGLYG
jgi:hypothetical protein